MLILGRFLLHALIEVFHEIRGVVTVYHADSVDKAEQKRLWKAKGGGSGIQADAIVLLTFIACFREETTASKSIQLHHLCLTKSSCDESGCRQPG
jgi:hypothetical protein